VSSSARPHAHPHRTLTVICAILRSYESTFSLQVANERFRRGRASALHNAPWQEPAVCVPHQLWRTWR
jgi:hypothetical protein